jgi:predicted nucleic acid-binding protein
MLDEYREVLSRPLFDFSPANVRALLDHIVLYGVHVVPEPMVERSVPDPGDLPFAEVAVAARVDCLVTGNLKHFVAIENLNVPVLTPAEFLDGLRRMLDEGSK